MPKLLTISKTINHFLCDNWADFQSARPFHIIDHIIKNAIRISPQAGKSFNFVISCITRIVSKIAHNAMITYTEVMKYLGIDYGAKRVGLAMSDERGDFAYPLKVLENTKDLVVQISEICKENKIDEIIVGESKDFKQMENEVMKEITPFALNLKKYIAVPIHMHPEFLTSQEAERLQGKNEMHDASAAAIILKSYLDTNKNNG